MNIFYEESGQFKVAAVVQKNDATYQVDTQHGKRTKVKANNVFAEFEMPMADFLEKAQAEAAEIDTDLLWEVCGEAEFSAAAIAEDYFGHAPGQIELAATLMALYGAPMYFYKKAKGVFKAAPEETLKQALAAIERKKQQDAQIEAWAAELQQGGLPAEISADLKTILHAPDKQTLTYKAFTKAADAMKLSPLALAQQSGGVASIPQYLRDGFEMKYFPRGIAFADLPVPVLADLPRAEVEAFSIDDDATTEVDDALSLTDLAGGGKRVGIHIAAPALAIAPGSDMEKTIAERQSTVYFPGDKITMLPDDVVSQFTLKEGETCPAVSMYLEVSPDFTVLSHHSRVDRVDLAADNCLVVKDDLSREDYRIDGLMRHCPVASNSLDLYVGRVDPREDCSREISDGPRRQVGAHMVTESVIGFREPAVEAVGYHLFRSAAYLFGRLGDSHQGAFPLVSEDCHRLKCSMPYGHVQVMSACMHHWRLLTL